MKILLVEDERELASAIKRVLTYSKYDVDCAYDGLTGLAMATESEYNLIISDIMMPRLDGIGLVAKLREHDIGCPILLLTAKGEIDDKVAGLDAGADDYLTKPFQIKELLARVRALLRRKGEVSEAYKIGNVTLDFDTFELRTPTASVRLTNKEYRLMECLIRNKNVLLSTERLMENVWDYDSDAEINVVWAFLSSLRKKLDQIGADQTIISVRGVGYKLGERQ
ncbi:MAG: response regulator transcription factor [Bacilli bacterium]|nr:response regulator transcription factor [Bacilli bacterium]